MYVDNHRYALVKVEKRGADKEVTMDTAVNRDHFLEKLNALIAGKREDNCFYFSKENVPTILQSNNGREFSNEVISKICAIWKDVKIVHGKPRHRQTQGSVERANQVIQNMITAWMNDNHTDKESEGLLFVQFAKNTAYHEGIRQSPYETMFGFL
ncbi:KRAB-A domain-containing protein 2 [Trichonephila clavipes]|nr:KRAB-A domain-containing protein 2 [Trichonephila clavipes]